MVTCVLLRAKIAQILYLYQGTGPQSHMHYYFWVRIFIYDLGYTHIRSTQGSCSPVWNKKALKGQKKKNVQVPIWVTYFFFLYPQIIINPIVLASVFIIMYQYTYLSTAHSIAISYCSYFSEMNPRFEKKGDQAIKALRFCFLFYIFQHLLEQFVSL